MSQTAQRSIARYIFWFSTFQHGQVVAKMAGMVREVGAGRVACSGHLVSQWQGQDKNCRISVLHRSLSIAPLEQTSSYLVTPLSALYNQSRNSFFLSVSTFIDVLTKLWFCAGADEGWQTSLLFTTSSARSCMRKNFHTRLFKHLM